MKILGLDVGEKRIGVAKVDSSTRIAVPVGYLNVDGTEWQQLIKLSTTHNTLFFVIGLPRSNEGNETKQTEFVKEFANMLATKIPGARIRFQDESLTSVEAEERLKSSGRKYEKGEIDAEAASIILQDFIESFSGPPDQAIIDEISAAEPVSPPPEQNTNPKKKEPKPKMKKITKIITVVVVLAILGLLAGGGALFIREQRYKKYAEQFAEIEAGMKAEVFDFTIRPGETIFDVKKHLLEAGYTEGAIEEGFNAKYDFEMLSDRPAGATLEGYLHSETHEFYKDATVEEILTVFLRGMEEVIQKNNLRERYHARGLSLFEGITLASIVQKEARAEEQATVAQVFFSRLDSGISLGSDVTVSYALDVIDPERVTYTDNQAALAVDSCYNTRIRAGLPCGPISNPGESALLAVAEPSDSTYFYFLTGDDGLMYYSYTESEHIQNIHAHCQELCNVAL